MRYKQKSKQKLHVEFSQPAFRFIFYEIVLKERGISVRSCSTPGVGAVSVKPSCQSVHRLVFLSVCYQSLAEMSNSSVREGRRDQMGIRFGPQNLKKYINTFNIIKLSL